jgi:predicted alpha/beta superfamily hydrolase
MAELVQSPIVIPNTCKVRIKSENNYEYEISIALPPSYNKSDNKYPVLYLLDSNQYFTAITGILSFIYEQKAQYIIKGIPEIILVGIGYPTTKRTEILTYRSRDYTPEIDEEEYMEMADELGCDPEYKPNSGGAAEFIGFIKDTLMPYIESNYKVNTDDKTIAGHSYGGLFPSYVLFKEPTVFNRYVICSPSLWYKKGVVFGYEDEYSKKHDTLEARVFIGSGANEKNEIRNILEGVRRLVETFDTRQYKGLVYDWAVFSDEGHFSVIPASFMRGILSVYKQTP